MALTEAGRVKLRDIEEHRASTLQEYLREWSQHDAEETAKILRNLAGSLKDSARAKAAGPITENPTH